jgi:hypothetical protein
VRSSEAAVADCVASAVALDRWIGDTVIPAPTITICGGLPERRALSCFLIALEHYGAIVKLCEVQIYPSAFALLRPLQETWLRGHWINSPASQGKLENRPGEVKFPRQIKQLIDQLKGHPCLVDDITNSVWKENWAAFCGYAHTGTEQLRHYEVTESTHAHYDLPEIRSALQFSGSIALLAALGFAAIAKDPPLAEAIKQKCTEIANWGTAP